MSGHVTSETRTVFRGGGRRYLTAHAAYYNAAKQMVKAKYPPELDGAYEDSAANAMGISREVWEARAERRYELFFSNDWPDPSGERDGFDSNKWVHFVLRLARFLRFRDGVSSRLGYTVLPAVTYKLSDKWRCVIDRNV